MINVKPRVFDKILEKFRELDYTGYVEQYPPFASWEKISSPAEFAAKAWKESLKEPASLDLFVNIPFCARKCLFCFLPVVCVGENPEKRRRFVEKYLAALEKEAGFYSGLFGKRKFSTLYVGGGTPSILEPAQINSFFDFLKKFFSFSEKAQFVIEVYPRDINKKIASEFAKNGVTRACLGVQSLDRQVLTETKRRQDEKEVRKAFGVLRESGIAKINIDLICGLPRQSEESFMKDLKTVVRLRPDQVHVNAFINTPYTAYSMKGGKPPDYGRIEAVRKKSFAVLKSEGYLKIDSDSVGLTLESKNFQAGELWKKKSLLGLGFGAISRAYGRMRAANSVSFENYCRLLEKGIPPLESGARMTLRDEMIYHTLEKAGAFNRVDFAEFEKQFGKKFENVFPGELKTLLNLGAAKTKKSLEIPPSLRSDLRRAFYRPKAVMRGLKNSWLKAGGS